MAERDAKTALAGFIHPTNSMPHISMPPYTTKLDDGGPTAFPERWPGGQRDLMAQASSAGFLQVL
jgi:hypothetical protein